LHVLLREETSGEGGLGRELEIRVAFKKNQ